MMKLLQLFGCGTLTNHQAKVVSAFGKTDHDADILHIYCVVYGVPEKNTTYRTMQQKLAPTFVAINEKWKAANVKAKIEPGKLKRTYRVSTGS